MSCFSTSIQYFVLYIFSYMYKDPKRKVHKSIKGVLRLEVERLHPTDTSNDSISENGSGNGPVESRVHFAETKNQNISFNGLLTNNSRCSLVNGKAASRNVPASGSHSFLSSDDVSNN